MSKFKIKRHIGQQIKINADTIITVVSTTNSTVSLLVDTAPNNLITIVPDTNKISQKISKLNNSEVLLKK